MKSRDTKMVGKDCLGENVFKTFLSRGFSSPICDCIEVSTHVKHIPLWKWVLRFVFFAGKNAQGGPVPGAQITHAARCPRSQVSFNLFHKGRSVSFTALSQRAPLQAKASGSKASELSADAFNSLNRDFPIPKTNVPTTEPQCKHHSIIHQPRACVTFWV